MQHAFDVRLRQQAAVSVDRQLAADFDAAVLDEILAFALLTKAVIFERDHRRDRETVVDLGEVHVLRREARPLVRQLRRLLAAERCQGWRVHQTEVRMMLAHA